MACGSSTLPCTRIAKLRSAHWFGVAKALSSSPACRWRLHMCSCCDIAPRGRGNICCAFSRTRPLGGIELLWHSLAASILSWYGALYALLLCCSVASRSRPADAIHPASKASESRLYTFSGETKEHLRKFRLTTSRAKDPQAVICTHRPFEPSILGFAPDRLTWRR